MKQCEVQSWTRDSAAATLVGTYVFVVGLWLLHVDTRGLYICRIFSCYKSSIKVVVVAKLKN